jgi:hypothetical protein
VAAEIFLDSSTAESFSAQVPEWLRTVALLGGGYVVGAALTKPFASDLAKPLARQLRPIRCGSVPQLLIIIINMLMPVQQIVLHI